MKFNMAHMPAACRAPLKIGTVYAARGGRSGQAPTFWILIALTKEHAVLLGINHDGEIISAAKYAHYCIERWPVVGYCKEAEKMNLTLQMLTARKQS